MICKFLLYEMPYLASNDLLALILTEITLCTAPAELVSPGFRVWDRFPSFPLLYWFDAFPLPWHLLALKAGFHHHSQATFRNRNREINPVPAPKSFLCSEREQESLQEVLGIKGMRLGRKGRFSSLWKQNGKTPAVQVLVNPKSSDNSS